MTDAAPVRGSFAVSADDPFFEGHFPGHPVFPGIGQLARLADLALDPGSGIVRIESLRFRLAVSPGDGLDLSGSREGDRLRFELRRDDRVVTSGTLRTGHLRSGAVAGGPDAPLLVPLPAAGPAAAASLVPHRPPALLLEALEGASPDGVRARARVPEGHPCRRAGVAPGFLALEIASQAAAALETVLRDGTGSAGEATPGYLVLAREVDCVPVLPDAPLRVALLQDGVSPPLALYRFFLDGPAGALARGLIGTWIPTGAA